MATPANRFANQVAEITRKVTLDISEKASSIGVTGKFFETSEEKIAEVKIGLDSNSDARKVEALKRCIAVSIAHVRQNSAEAFPGADSTAQVLRLYTLW
jgi:hypothetical protein